MAVFRPCFQTQRILNNFMRKLQYGTMGIFQWICQGV
jgi:hypothetical protein